MLSVERWLCSPSCSYLKRWRELLYDTPLGLREQGSREALHSLHRNASVELIIAVSSPENPFRGVCVVSGWWCETTWSLRDILGLERGLNIYGKSNVHCVCVFSMAHQKSSPPWRPVWERASTRQTLKQAQTEGGRLEAGVLRVRAWGACGGCPEDPQVRPGWRPRCGPSAWPRSPGAQEAAPSPPDSAAQNVGFTDSNSRWHACLVFFTLCSTF